MQGGLTSPKSKSMNTKVSITNLNSSPSRTSPLEQLNQTYNRQPGINGTKEGSKYSFSKKEREKAMGKEIMGTKAPILQNGAVRPSSSYSSQNPQKQYQQGEPVSPLLTQHHQPN